MRSSKTRLFVAVVVVMLFGIVGCFENEPEFQPTAPNTDATQNLASVVEDYDSPTITAEIAEYFANNPGPAAKALVDVTVNVEISQPPDGYMTEDECITVVGTASAVGGAAIDLHLVLDSSGSLSWNDPSDFREQAAVALIQALNPAANITVGTIDFDENCFVASPLTLIGDDNGAAAIAAVQAMDQSGGTAIDCGINLAVNDFLANGRPGASRAVILFSDGESSAAAAMAAAAYASANNVVVNTVFLGSGGGQTLMENIANATGGFYLQTNDPQDLIDLFGQGPVTGITEVTVNGQVANLVAGTFDIDLCLACGANTITAIATATDGTQGSDEVTVTRICEIEVPVDIKPTSCPNPLNPKSNGVIPVAILGTADFDVTQIDPASIRLEGVEPVRWGLADVATPYYPFRGKQECSDCNEMGPDGFTDLTLKFKTQELVAALGTEDPGCLVLTITGKLKDEFGGFDIIGEDVMRLKVTIMPEAKETL